MESPQKLSNNPDFPDLGSVGRVWVLAFHLSKELCYGRNV